MRRLFAHSDFRRLFVGQGLSALGDWTGTVALVALALQLSGSPAAAGAVLVLRLAPGILAAPLAARVAPRWDRRRTMLAMDALRAGMVAAVPLVHSLWWVYCWAFLLEAASILFLPARDASVPELVDRDQLGVANSLLLFSSYGAIPLGAALFSACNAVAAALGVAGGRFEVAFFFDALTFVASFALVWRITGISPTRRRPPEGVAAAAKASFTAGLRLPLVRWLLPAAVTASVGLGSLFTLGLPFLRQLAGGTATGFGLLVASFGLGACVGTVIVAVVPQLGLGAVRTGVALQGTLFVVVALVPSLPLAFVAAGLFGGSAAVTLAVGMRCLQDGLGMEERRLALTVFHVVIRVALSAAALAAGVVAARLTRSTWPLVGEITAVRQVLFASGILALVGALLVRNPAGRPLRRPSGHGTTGHVGA